MAIVKMKKLRVIAMADQREALLRDLLHLGCVEISEPEGKLSDPAWATLLGRERSTLLDRRSEITDAAVVMEAVKRYGGIKEGMFVVRPGVSEAEFLSEERMETAREVTVTVKTALQELSRLQSEEGRLLSRQAALRPWAALDMPLELEGTANTLFRQAVCPAGVDIGTVRIRLEAAELAAEIYEISADKQQRYCLLVFHKEEEAALQEELRTFGFSMTAFQGVSGTAEENLSHLERELLENQAAQKAAEAAVGEMAKHWADLKLYADRLEAEAARETNTERLLTDGTILFFEGWAPAEHMDRVAELLESSECAWSAEDPAEEEYPDVPVKLKNNWLTRPLNMVTEMYSLPAYDNVDPNPLMAPFFILFYGIMMADMGYGLLMFFAGLLISRKYRPKGTMGHLFGLLTLCGVSTFIMGAITGGFFGDFLTQAVKLTSGKDFALPALFAPLDDTLMILVGSMCLGAVQIVTGMVISFVRKLQKGKYLDALFEEVTWWLVFAGIGCAVLLKNMVVLCVGLALVVIGPAVTNKGFGKITGIFGSVYNHVTGYFGDILSYARLMALMLAGSVIAQVFNTLGAIPGNIVVFVIISMAGNALNFALNLLGCYVHDLRLQCLEYFGKFYEDGGKPFRPLAFNTKFVDIK